jgi:hypothetical protein
MTFKKMLAQEREKTKARKQMADKLKLLFSNLQDDQKVEKTSTRGDNSLSKHFRFRIRKSD